MELLREMPVRVTPENSCNIGMKQLLHGHWPKGAAVMRGLLFAIIVLGGTAMADAQTRFAFDQDPVDTAPPGFLFTVTAKGAPGKWVVVQDSDQGHGRVLAQTDANGRGSRFPMAIAQEVTAADVDLSVQLKPVRGSEDQAGGLVWRYQDQDNYYIVRANALEGNVVLYKVQNGRRTDLPVKGEGRTYGKKAAVPSGRWSELRVVAAGPHFDVFWNGSKLFEVEDATFPQRGKVGVWTKADSVTYFDNLVAISK
jgi:hypothetical protein